jgi:RNA 3'-terminal phosphate cyclase
MDLESDEKECAIVLSLISRREIKLGILGLGLGDRDRLERFLLFIKLLSPSSEYSFTELHLLFTPGTLQGGHVHFKSAFPVSYFLYHILPICAFFKLPLKIKIEGITNSKSYLSVDSLKCVYSKVLSYFGIGIEVKINRRALDPSTDGEVVFLSGVAESIESVDFSRKEALDRVVNINYSSRLGSDALNRITNYNRNSLRRVTSSVKVYNDIGNRSNCGDTPGYGIVLMATGKNTLFYSEGISGTAEKVEDLCELTIKDFLKSMRGSGVLDRKTLQVLFVLLALSKTDISTLLISKIDARGRETLRLLSKMLNYRYKIEEYRKSAEEMENGVPALLILKSSGTGYSNIYRGRH